MSLIIQEVEDIQNQHFWKDVGCCNNEEERELEEALSLCDLPISKITSDDETQENEVKDEANEILDNNDFDFGSLLVGSATALDGDQMCTADEVFSGGQILPYRSSVSSMSGLRSVSRSDSMDRRGFGSRSSSSRSSSIRSHYSAASSGSGSSSGSSNNTNVSTKTVPMVSKAVKVQNQFHSYPSPRPQILGSSTRFPITYASSVEKKSKMWEVLKLGLVRTPEIELRDLKSRHGRTNNNFGKTVTILPRNNSIGSGSSSRNNDRARKSCSNDGNLISEFVLEMQKRKNQLPENKIGNDNTNNSGFFKSCKCSVGAIEPMPCTRPNYGGNFGNYGKFGNNHKYLSVKQEVLSEDKRRNNNIKQGTTKVMTSQHHHHRRTFEWLKNLSHASVLNE